MPGAGDDAFGFGQGGVQLGLSHAARGVADGEYRSIQATGFIVNCPVVSLDVNPSG
jgi:hypothetical protein